MKRSSTLQAEAKEFYSQAAMIQDDKIDQTVRDSLLLELQRLYLRWYRESLALMAKHGRIDVQNRFRQYYKGHMLLPKITYFLTHGAKIYKYRGRFPGAPDWVANIKHSFVEPLTEQINELATLGE